MRAKRVNSSIVHSNENSNLFIDAICPKLGHSHYVIMESGVLHILHILLQYANFSFMTLDRIGSPNIRIDYYR